MKRPSLFLLLITVSISAFCQSTQNGVVKEYNGAKKKTPIAGVELVVNNAGSHVSDRNGKFMLSFRTLKPGDKVELRKIEKNGYEIFNKEALDAWRIANDGSEFMIVLCKSSKFKALKDQYNAVANKSYAEQQKKDEEKLATLLKEGQIQQTEYEQKLQELKHHYDEQLENLDNYIDRFARIDLETLSKEEQKIIEMVQAGKIKEAIAAYEAMHLEEQYAKAVENIHIANHAITQLVQVIQSNQTARENTYDVIKRMNDTRRLQGGEENFRKIGESLKMIAESDTTYLYPLYAYALFMNDQRNIAEASKYFDIILRHETDVQNKAYTLQNYATVLLQENPNKALILTFDAISILDSLIKSQQNVVNNKNKIVANYINLGCIYTWQNNFEQAKKYYQLAISIQKEVGFKDLRSQSDDVKALYNLALLYMNYNDYIAADTLLYEAYQIQKDILTKSSAIEEKYVLYSILVQLGTSKGKIHGIESCIPYFDEAITIFQKLSEFNPQAYKPEGTILYNQIGVLCTIYHEYEKGADMYAKAYQNELDCAGDASSLRNKIYLIIIQAAWAQCLAYVDGQQQKSLEMIEQSQIELEILYAKIPNIVQPFYNIILQQKASILIQCHDYSAAHNAIDQALTISTEDANSWDTKGEIYSIEGQWDDALACYHKAISIDPEYFKIGISNLRNALIERGLIEK